MLLTSELFYQRFGTRTISQLQNPRLFPFAQLPRLSMFHYVSMDHEHIDIDPSQLIFLGYKSPIAVEYVTTLASLEGKPNHKTGAAINTLTKAFHKQHKDFKFYVDGRQILGNVNVLSVQSYGYMDHFYKYAQEQQQSGLVPYYRYRNMLKTVVARMIEKKEFGRENFLQLHIPTILPSLMVLQQFTKKVQTSFPHIFESWDKYLILELFRWLDDKASKDSPFSDIPPELLPHVFIAITSPTGRASIVSLAYLNSWHLGQKNQTNFSSITQVPGLILQKILLKHLMVIQADAPAPEEQTATQAPTGDVEDITIERELEEDQKQYQYQHPFDEGGGSDQGDYAELVKPNGPASVNPDESADAKDAQADKLGASSNLKHQMDQIDEELKALEIIQRTNLRDKGIHLTEDGEEVDVIAALPPRPKEQIVETLTTRKSIQTEMKARLDEAAEYGVVTAAEYRKFMKRFEDADNLPSPYDPKIKLKDAAVRTREDNQIPGEAKKLPVPEFLPDKSMGESSLQAFQERYIKHKLPKDMQACVTAIQRGGTVVENYTVAEDTGIMGTYETHEITIRTIPGNASTLRWRIPKINPDGTFIANGNKYVMRKQCVDVPIRRINENTTQLSSYYGKTAVSRCDKKANSSVEWLYKQIDAQIMSDAPHVVKVAPANVFDNQFEAPFIYSAIAARYKAFRVDNLQFNFDHHTRQGNLLPAGVEKYEVNGRRICGFTDKQAPILVNTENDFFVMDETGEKRLGTIFDVLKFPINAAPVDFAEIRIFSKQVPVGFVLAYYLTDGKDVADKTAYSARGFSDLLLMLDVPYRVVEGKRKVLEEGEYALQFADKSYIFHRKHMQASLVLAGFLAYEKQIKQFPAEYFDRREVYLNIMEEKGLPSLYVREINSMKDLFIDPLTEEWLVEKNLPTTFPGLVYEAVKMLKDYHHPDSQETSVQRFRGYERVPGFVYNCLATAVRSYNGRTANARSKVDMSPFEVSTMLMQDETIKIVEDINPIQHLKEQEAVTFTGFGGRGKDSMTKETRAYHPDSVGVVSPSTVDSADVGINVFLCANPRFENLSGTVSKNSKDAKFEPAQLLSTMQLCSPGASFDDGKRMNFIDIQAGHAINAVGYRQSRIRTGMEYVVPQRTSDLFAVTAKKKGKVLSIDQRGIIVEYEDGEKLGVSLGRQYGKAEGSVYPHDITTNMQVGQKFEPGMAIAYNQNFFEPDIIDPRFVVMKLSMPVTVALLDCQETFEDSSIVSAEHAEKLVSNSTKIRSVTVKFEQTVIEPKKAGEKVKAKDILMILQDKASADIGNLDEETVAALRRQGNDIPKAKYSGTIDRIEVIYHGDKQDMSPSLKALADASDRQLAAECRSTGRPVITGFAKDHRIAGVPLTLDQAEVRYYITMQLDAGVADKRVLGLQLKNTVGQKFKYQLITESGEKVHTLFSYSKILGRIVGSPTYIGTLHKMLELVDKAFIEAYSS